MSPRDRTVSRAPGAGASAASQGGLARPSLSPLLWAALAAWAGAFAGTEVALLAWREASLSLLLAGLGALGLLLFLGTRLRGPGGARTACVVGALAMAVALARGWWLPAVADRIEASGPREWTATVVADPQEGPYGTSVRVRLDAARSLVALVNVPKGESPPAYGRRLVLSSRVKVALRGAPNSADAFRRGTLLRARPWRLRQTGWAAGPLGRVAEWRADVLDSLRADGSVGAASLASMLFDAEPTGAGVQALEDARTAGVAWAIAASGLHLAALVLLSDRCAAFLGLTRRGRAVMAIGTTVLVALACGLKLSLVRAAFAAAAGVLARAAGRRRDGTAALGAVLLAVVVLDPGAAYDVGLLLGATAVTAIGVFGGLAREWFRPLVGRTASRLLGASAAAQVAVAPLSAALFGGVALLGPLVLLVSAPFVEAAVMIGFAGAALLPVLPGVAAWWLAVASQIAAAAAGIWSFAARLPGAFTASSEIPGWIGLLWAGAAAALWVRWPLPPRAARVRGAAALLVALLVVASALRGTVTTGIVVLDVGQGDAILIRDAGHAVLVDTGPDPVVLRRALARAGIRSLDGVVLTHAHDDHVGGLDGLAGVTHPGWIAVPDVEDDAVDALAARCATRSDTVVRLKRDMTFRVGGTNVRVLWPRGGERMLPANDTSVILLAERGGRRALLLGDGEDRAQLGALDAWATRVDLVKVAHHGSPNGNVPEALSVWQPTVALISVGTGNRFGHPSRVALDTLVGVGARVHRTDLEGDLAYAWPPASAAPAPGAGALAGRAAPSRGALAGRAAPSTGALLCDNRHAGPTQVWPTSDEENTPPWPLPISAISSPSTSSTALRSCCSSAPSGGCATALRPSPISTSTWRPSTGIPPPRETSSTPPTLCRS